MELPNEILILIFKYLSKSDRRAASETCQSWYAAANALCFRKNKVAVFFKSTENCWDYRNQTIFFGNDPGMCSRYRFHEIEISSRDNSFWDTMGEHITHLTLDCCDICEKVFTYILEKCTNLEELEVVSCKDLFMSGRLLEGKTEGLLLKNLENLKSLNLSNNQYLTDALFNRFATAAPALQQLDFSFCNVQFHLGLVKKFYPPSTDVFKNPSESVLTFHFIMQVIAANAKKFQRLTLSHTLIDGSALRVLSLIPNLQLVSLYLHGCDQLTNTGIQSLCVHQTSLKELNLALCNRVTDQSLVYICTNLVNLEYLNIQRCRAVSNLGLSELGKLVKLKALNISQCENITKHGLLNGICAKENNVLEELDLHSMNLDEQGLIEILEKLPQLRFLNLSYCFNAVTDETIQLVFKKQRLLRILKISHCDKVSDVGLTGMKKENVETAQEHPDLPCDELPLHPRIHLGSRAEEEIVRDARRKRDVMHMCKNISLDSYSGHSLASLNGLLELDISGCNRITDVSMTYAFHLKELVNLDLSRCQQITKDGTEQLVKNCPSIEYIKFSDCYNLNDEAIGLIVSGLKRLKHLELRGCNQLTDATVEAIKTHCNKLRFLDIQGCRHISPELACSISLPTLHTVLMTKPGPYITDGIKDRQPAPAFLPALMRRLRLH